MWRKTSSILIASILTAVSAAFCLAACPSADFSGDCFVNLKDFAQIAAQWTATDFNDLELVAKQWLTTDPCIPDDMAYIPGGTFEMGDSLGDGSYMELPVHTVTVDSFFMGKCEISNQQYCDYLNDAVSLGEIKISSGIVYASFDDSNSYPYCDTSTGENDSQIACSRLGIFSARMKSGRHMSNDPMVQVTWYGAVAYCNWRSRNVGKKACYNLSTWDCDFSNKGYRLPTEAEWEYAARGGLASKRFPWGDTVSHNQANYSSYWEEGIPYFPYDISLTEGYHPIWDDRVYPYTSPAASFAANRYGLYDLTGNVWEWSNDWFDGHYYDYSPTSNPTGPITGTLRVLRGGCWRYDAQGCRVSRRSAIEPDYRSNGSGFRIVLNLN